MGIDQLPAELLDRVVDSLEGDLPSLRSCALVRRSWLPRCRAYIHSSVQVQINEDANQMDQTLCRYSSPALRNLVQMVQIDMNIRPLRTLKAIVATLVQHFAHLREINVHLLFPGMRIRLAPGRPAYLAIQEHPRDVSLTLAAVMADLPVRARDDLFELLRAVPRLSRLTFTGQFAFSWEGCDSDWHTGPGTSSAEVVPALHHVHLGKCVTVEDRDRLLQWLTAGRVQCPLDSLALDGSCTAEMNAALATVGDALRDLRLDITEATRSTYCTLFHFHGAE